MARPAPAVVALTDATFDREIGNARPTLVVFTADWCAPCRDMRGDLAELARSVGGFARVAVADVEAAPQAAMRQTIVGVPTLVLYRGGTVLAEHLGSLKRRPLRGWLIDALDKAGP